MNKNSFLLYKKLFGRINYHQLPNGLYDDDGLYDQKAFYKVRNCFYSSSIHKNFAFYKSY